MAIVIPPLSTDNFYSIPLLLNPRAGPGKIIACLPFSTCHRNKVAKLQVKIIIVQLGKAVENNGSSSPTKKWRSIDSIVKQSQKFFLFLWIVWFSVSCSRYSCFLFSLFIKFIHSSVPNIKKINYIPYGLSSYAIFWRQKTSSLFIHQFCDHKKTIFNSHLCNNYLNYPLFIEIF